VGRPAPSGSPKVPGGWSRHARWLEQAGYGQAELEKLFLQLR
jgi:hypothetical protein